MGFHADNASDGHCESPKCDSQVRHFRGRTFSESDIFRVGHFQSRTFSKSDIFEVGHFRSRTSSKSDIFEVGHFRSRTFPESDISRVGHRGTRHLRHGNLAQHWTLKEWRALSGSHHPQYWRLAHSCESANEPHDAWCPTDRGAFLKCHFHELGDFR